MGEITKFLGINAKGYHLYNPTDNQVTWGIPPLLGDYVHDLFGPKSDYMFEIKVPTKDGGLVTDRSIIFPYVNTVEILRQSPTKVSYGIGATPVREHSIHRALTIRISGVSGLANRSGHNRQGHTTTASGPELLREFDAFLDYYQAMATSVGTSYGDPTIFAQQGYSGVVLIFRSFSEHIHVRVEPKSWNITRGTKNSRFTYMWDLEMQAYGPATPVKPPSLFSAIDDTMKFLTECVNSCANVVGMVGNAIESVNQVLATVKGPLQALGNISGQFARSVHTIQNVLQLPRAGAAYLSQAASRAWGPLIALRNDAEYGHLTGVGTDVARKLENMIRDVTDTWRSAVTLAGITGLNANSGYGFSITTGSTEIALESAESSDAGLSPARAGGDPFENAAVPGVDPQTIPADDPPIGTTIVVSEGDTVESIANTHMGSSTFWTAITETNKMPSPTMKSDGSELGVGDVLLIPSRGAYVERARLSPAQDMATDRFGKDLYLDAKTGDLEILGSEGLDIRCVNDKENLEQGIRNRLLTKQGESTYWPGYGLPPFVGGQMSGQTIGYIAATVNEQLLRDYRIVTLTELSLQDEGDSVSAFIGVKPVVGADVHVISSI